MQFYFDRFPDYSVKVEVSVSVVWFTSVRADAPSEILIKEHNRSIRLAQPEKSAVAEHSFNNDHKFNLQKTRLISTKATLTE
jgi:hypothetical protein